VDSEKMSKSLGNFFTIREATAMYAPMALRFWLLVSLHCVSCTLGIPSLPCGHWHITANKADMAPECC
jgi:tRNA synthetases class I (C) catalytic domain